MKVLEFGRESVNYARAKFDELKRGFTLTAAAGLSIVLFMFAPDKFYFIVFAAFFTATIYHAMQRIANLKHILTIDFRKNRLGLYQMSQKRFNEYEIIDEAGLPATINYRLMGKKAEIIIADGIKGKRIIVNPITSNIEFVRNYKKVAMDLKEKMNQTLNEMIDLKAKLRYETLLKSVELLERVSVVDKMDIPLEKSNGNGTVEKVMEELGINNE